VSTEGPVAAPLRPAMHRALRGMASVAAGVSIFSLQDAILKGMSSTYPVHEIVVLRSLVALPLLLLVAAAEEGGVPKLHRLGLHGVRGFVLYLSYTCYYLALARLPIAETVALSFTVPFFVAALARPMLGEKVRARSWVAIAIGFGGVLVIARPTSGLSDPAVLLPVASSLAYAVSAVLARRLGASESGGAMAMSAMAVYILGGLATALLLSGIDPPAGAHPSLLFLLNPWAWPSLRDGTLIALCGAIAACGFYCLAQGYRLAEANRAAPFEYAALPWAVVWGYVFFGNLPDAATLLGAAVIIAAGLWTVQGARAG
jgi:drug/metabolite transporter (DMT)-like permease